jgi:hypothetical protein
MKKKDLYRRPPVVRIVWRVRGVGERVVRLTRESGPQRENSMVSVKNTRNIIDAKVKPLKSEILSLTVYNNNNNNNNNNNVP